MKRQTLILAAAALALGLPGCSASRPISSAIDLASAGVTATLGGIRRTTDLATQAVHTTHAVADFVIPGKGPKDTRVKGDETELGSRDQARVASMRSQLLTIRSQVELYKFQHNDKAPDLFDTWDQLLQRTNLDGVVGQGKDFPYGPYLAAPPVNPFNDSSAVCGIDDIDPTAGWAWDPEAGAFYAVVSEADAERLGLDEADVATYRAE